jgi:hypothetical protein
MQLVTDFLANRGHKAHDVTALGEMLPLLEKTLAKYNPSSLEHFRQVVEPAAQPAILAGRIELNAQ